MLPTAPVRRLAVIKDDADADLKLQDLGTRDQELVPAESIVGEVLSRLGR